MMVKCSKYQRHQLKQDHQLFCFRFLVMAEGEAQEMMGTEHVIEVQS